MRPMLLVALALLFLAVQPAFALEQGLAGVKLGMSALQLITSPTFGSPAYIGPTGLSLSRESTQAGAGRFASSTATARPGYAGATPVGAPSVQSAGTYGSYSTAGARPVGAYGYSATAGGFGGAPGRPAGAVGAPSGAGQQEPQSTPVMVWLYKRGVGTLLLVELDAEGKATGVTIDGGYYPTAATGRGIIIGDTYSRIVERYGFPDQTAVEGGALVLRYLEAGLVFRLVDLRLTAMRLTTTPTLPIPGGGLAPSTAAQPTMQVRAAGIGGRVSVPTAVPAGGVPGPGGATYYPGGGAATDAEIEM